MDKKKRIYISTPIPGQDIEEVKKKSEELKQRIKGESSEPCEVITPFDVCSIGWMGYNAYMGRVIEALLDCDEVVFRKGWNESKGCLLEYEAARIYGKRITFE